MVKLLPSDVARLVLAYLQGHNLKNVSQKFLEESPDLEEVRQNPGCPVLPPLAKDLETILEEHATFIQDGKKNTQVNPVVIQLWRKLDAVVAQLKYEYLQEKLPPPQMKGVNSYLHNQRVRSRLSLNALRSQQKHGSGQINLGESSGAAHSPRDPSGGRTSRNSDRNSPESHEGIDGALSQQAQTSSTQESRNENDQGSHACQPSTSGTQREHVRSPKRKSITPRKKFSPEDLIPTRHTASQDTTTTVPLLYPEELVEFPQILESLLSDQTLPEKLAGTINKVLPNTEFSNSSVKEREEANTTADPPSSRTVDEGSVMDRRALEEVIEMASSDPAFDSLFSLFNVEREKFVEEEKKRLIGQSASDSSTDQGRDEDSHGNEPSVVVPRQLFQSELGEKQRDSPSQKDAESSNEKQAESSKENLTQRAEEDEGKKEEEKKEPRKDEDSCDEEAPGVSDDEIVEMETESISTSAARDEKSEADSSYLDVEITETDSPPPKETSHQSEEEVDITEADKTDPGEDRPSEEEVDVTDIEKSDPVEGGMSGKNAAQRLSSANQEKIQQEGVGEGAESSQSQNAASEEQKDEEASTSDKGKKVKRRRRRDRTTFSQGTRRSQRLEAKKKENPISDGSPNSHQEQGEETPGVSPAKHRTSLTQSNLMDRAKTPNLEAANEYAKKVLASMANGASKESLTSDPQKPMVMNVVTMGDSKPVSSGNLFSQSDVSAMATSSNGKNCMTVRSLTNTTATVLSTRQNPEITTTKSRTSKGKVTVMAPPGAPIYLKGSDDVSGKDASNVRAETSSGKSEKNISEFAQPQSTTFCGTAANSQASSTGAVGMEAGKGAHSRVEDTTNSTNSLETNISVSSKDAAARLISNRENVYNGTQQNATPAASSVQGALKTEYMPCATSVNSMNNAYSTSHHVPHHQTAKVTNSDTTNATGNHLITAAVNAPQYSQGSQYATRLGNNMQHVPTYQFIPTAATQNMQPPQQVVGFAANTQNTSSLQYIPASIQAGENQTATLQASSNLGAGNISREQYGPGSSINYSIAGAQTSSLPLLVYNPAALQSTNVLPGSLNLQSNSDTSGNQGSMNVVFYAVENNNNRTIEVVQANPGSSGILGSPQIITLHQAADGLLSLSGAVQSAVPSSETGQITAVPQKVTGKKAKGKSSKKFTSKSKHVNSQGGLSTLDASGSQKSGTPLIPQNSLLPAEHQASLHGTTVAHDQGPTANSAVAHEVVKKSSGLDGSDVIPQRHPSGSNHLNLDNQGVATLINEELEQSLENASTQDIDFIFKAITMTPQKEQATSDCAKYSPLDKAIADKLKQSAVGLSNLDSSTDMQKKGQPSPLKKAAMQMQGEMLRNKKCVRKVFSEEGSVDRPVLENNRTETAERTAKTANMTESGNRTLDHSREPKEYVLESRQIMNGFVPTSASATNNVRGHSHVMHTSLPDALGGDKITPSPKSEKTMSKSESYESSKQSEVHQVVQGRNPQKTEERQHPCYKNGMGHPSQRVLIGLNENTTIPKCNKDRPHKMEGKYEERDFKYRLDVEKKQKLEQRMRTRLKKENCQLKNGGRLESKDNGINKGKDLRTSENIGIDKNCSSEEVRKQIINERERSEKGGRDDSAGRRVERPVHGGVENAVSEKGGDKTLHGHGASGDFRVDDKGRDRVKQPGGEASGFQRRRDVELDNRSNSDGREPPGHHILSHVKDEKTPLVSERTLRGGDEGGDNLWSRIDRAMNGGKWVEGKEGEKSEKNLSSKVEDVEEGETDSDHQEESCSRTEGYKRILKRGTPQRNRILVASGGREGDVESGQEAGETRRSKGLASEEKLRENENPQNVGPRESEGSQSVGVHQDRSQSGFLKQSYHTDENSHSLGRSPNIEGEMTGIRHGEPVYDLNDGGSKSCSTPITKETVMPGQGGKENSSSREARLERERLKNVTQKGMMGNGTFTENVDQSGKVREQQSQNENMRRTRELHAGPDVSPILANEDILSSEEDESYSQEIGSCSRTRVHYSKTNFKWNKSRTESSSFSRSGDLKRGEPSNSSPQPLVNGPNPISSTGSNNRTHSVDGHANERTRVVSSHSNQSGGDKGSSLGRLQASVREGRDTSGALAGPSKVRPRSGREDETKRTSLKATKRPSEDGNDPYQEKKKRKKKKSRSVDDFPSDFDLQKFFAKLKYA